MTPKEVSGRREAIEELNKRRAEELDALAWMTGRYTAQGYHQPQKYPKEPGMVKRIEKEIPDDDEIMKDKMLAFAEIHNAEVANDP
jgi:hypothetical protein